MIIAAFFVEKVKIELLEKNWNEREIENTKYNESGEKLKRKP